MDAPLPILAFASASAASSYAYSTLLPFSILYSGQVLANEEIRTLISALGSGIGEDFNVDNLNYHKVYRLADVLVFGVLKILAQKLRYERFDCYARRGIAELGFGLTLELHVGTRAKNAIDNFNLVGKLTPCTGKKPENNELFIVEGDSAGGTAKQARVRQYQSILPLRGKPLNVQKKTALQALQNEEIKTLVSGPFRRGALFCHPPQTWLFWRFPRTPSCCP